jgi:hypothetical protein
MSTKILLTRKEHEIYFIPFPEKQISKARLAQFVSGKLQELHPGFSSASFFDAQNVTLNRRVWIMVTVTEQVTITEKRIMNPRAAFFTATSLLVHTPGFVNQPPYSCGDETIGYDPVANAPVSIPNDGNKSTAMQTDTINTIFKNPPFRSRVFRKKTNPLWFILPLSLLCILFFIVFAYRLYAHSTLPEEEPPVAPLPPPNEMLVTPSPFFILSRIADAIVQAKGVILNWQYNEQSDPALVLTISALEPLSIYSIINGFAYMHISGISDIQYLDGKPVYTVSISFAADRYYLPESILFAGQEAVFSLLEALREDFRILRLAVLSETLPSNINGKALCTMALTCNAFDLVSALVFIENRLETNKLRIQHLTLSLDHEEFAMNFAFSPIFDENKTLVFSDTKNESILKAFGYQEEPPPDEPIVETAEVRDPYSKIGVIRDEQNPTIVYYRGEDGKIVIREE